MPTLNFYNHTTRLLLTNDLSAETLAVVLLDSNASFDATDTTLAEVTATGTYEVYGNGWPQGGETLANLSLTTIDTNDASLDADDVEVPISGGDLGPISAYVIAATSLTDSPPLAYITLDAPKTVLANNAAVISFDASGIFTGVVA